MCTRAISTLLISALLFCGCVAPQAQRDAGEVFIESKTIKDFYNSLSSEKNSTIVTEQNSTQMKKGLQQGSVEIKNGSSIKDVLRKIYEKDNKKCVVKGEEYTFNIDKSLTVNSVAELNLLLKKENVPLVVEIISVYGYDRVYINGVKNVN